MVITIESIPKNVVALASSNVSAREVSLSSTKPTTEMGWMEELTCATTDTTGFEVETETLTVAFEPGEALISRARAAD